MRTNAQHATAAEPLRGRLAGGSGLQALVEKIVVRAWLASESTASLAISLAHAKMRFGIIGQATAFALGVWIGFLIAGPLEPLVRQAFAMPPARTSPPLPFESVLTIFVAVAAAIPFVAWTFVRARRSRQVVRLSGIVPLVLGVAYGPLFVVTVPILFLITGQGQGTRIGTGIGLFLLGFPVLSAELCFRLAQWRFTSRAVWPSSMDDTPPTPNTGQPQSPPSADQPEG